MVVGIIYIMMGTICPSVWFKVLFVCSDNSDILSAQGGLSMINTDSRDRKSVRAFSAAAIVFIDDCSAKTCWEFLFLSWRLEMSLHGAWRFRLEYCLVELFSS